VSLRRTPFFRVLHRPRLFLGGEREPTLMMAIVAAGLAVSGQNLVTLAVAAALWFGSIGILLSIGTQKGPPIGVQKGPPWQRLVPVVHRGDPRAAECPLRG
jgi:type IV secretory pathway TrbD component